MVPPSTRQLYNSLPSRLPEPLKAASGAAVPSSGGGSGSGKSGGGDGGGGGGGGSGGSGAGSSGGGGGIDPAVATLLAAVGRAADSFPADFAAALMSGKVIMLMDCTA
ncbi:hypothetical protein FOA52_014985 [Chlamydomonas sp. UWO 241]|nr:hypothetical protein FOA52_014985 [Chlamydomonas sp. UWO 241]